MLTTTTGRALLDAAASRRSVRRFTTDEISKATLRTLIESAGRAPSAFNLQPWRWVAVRDETLKSRLQEAAYGQPQVGAAPVLLVLYTDTLDALETVEQTFSSTLPADKAASTKAHLAGTLGAQSDAEREAWGAGRELYRARLPAAAGRDDGAGHVADAGV